MDGARGLSTKCGGIVVHLIPFRDQDEAHHLLASYTYGAKTGHINECWTWSSTGLCNAMVRGNCADLLQQKGKTHATHKSTNHMHAPTSNADTIQLVRNRSASRPPRHVKSVLHDGDGSAASIRL
jgi:hypothetical protein